MSIDIRTIGTVKHKDGSTEDVTCFGKNYEGIVFETLQGNRYLYREYCDEHVNVFNNPYLLYMRCDQFYKFDYKSCTWEEVNHIIDSITIKTKICTRPTLSKIMT